jgi:TrwC relaxase
MLRVFVLKNAVGTSAYHWTEILRAREREVQRMGAELHPGWERTCEEQIRAGYYTQEKAGIWYGKGAQRAGLPECVTQDHLEKLLAGLDINGEQMGARLNTTRRGEAYERDEQTRETSSTRQPVSRSKKRLRWRTAGAPRRWTSPWTRRSAVAWEQILTHLSQFLPSFSVL